MSMRPSQSESRHWFVWQVLPVTHMCWSHRSVSEMAFCMSLLCPLPAMGTGCCLPCSSLGMWCSRAFAAVVDIWVQLTAFTVDQREEVTTGHLLRAALLGPAVLEREHGSECWMLGQSVWQGRKLLCWSYTFCCAVLPTPLVLKLTGLVLKVLPGSARGISTSVFVSRTRGWRNHSN